MMRCTLGTKLTLWSAIIVAVALVASALTSDIFVYRTERRELDQELRQSANHFFELFRGHGSSIEWVVSHEIEEVFSPDDANRFVLIRSADGRALYRSRNMPAGIDLPTGSGMHNARIGPTAVRLGVFHEHGLKLYLAGNTAEFTELIAKLVIAHLVALPFVLAVVALGAWWLGQQALRPVRAMADAAESIRPEELDWRLPRPVAQADEIGRLARVFNEMLERLQRGFQQATRFSTDASHELRTPLAVQRATIEHLLEDSTLTEAQREAVSEVQFQTHRLISITNTLLLLARADAGRLPLQLADADLRDLMLDCFEDARILGEQRGVRVECKIDAPGFVRVDELRIRQALLNLLDNAVKYNEPGGRVEMRLTVADDECRVRVGNTGPGISAAEQAGLFERFFRAGQQEDTPGSGLGLSLARELARSHEGDVVLLGSREGWTEFELSLPLRLPNPGSPLVHGHRTTAVV
jgi:signal transduction histidine kinase